MFVLEDDPKGQDPAGNQGQDPNKTSGQDPKAGNGQDPDPAKTGLTPEQLAEELKKVRAEAAETRKAKKAAEDKLAEFEKAQMTDVEKKEARLKELEAANLTSIERVIKSELRVAAMKLGIDPELAGDLALANKTVRDLIKFENGDVSGIEEALKELQSRYPILADKSDKTAEEGDKPKDKESGVRLNPSNPPGSNGTSQRPSDEQINKMSREELKANWGKIFK